MYLTIPYFYRENGFRQFNERIRSSRGYESDAVRQVCCCRDIWSGKTDVEGACLCCLVMFDGVRLGENERATSNIEAVTENKVWGWIVDPRHLKQPV